MARLIVKSPYFKGGGAKQAGGYLRYIATRERVEILPDDRPPTKRQTQLIEKLTKDFPDTKTLLEYGDYAAHPTKFNASQFLTLAMEENWSKVQELDGYAKYIATRPRAERMGEHGLFGDEDAVDLNEAMAEVNSYSGNIWTHIIRSGAKMRSGLGSIKRTHGGRCCGRTGTTSRRRCTSCRRTFAGMRRSTMRAVIRTFT